MYEVTSLTNFLKWLKDVVTHYDQLHILINTPEENFKKWFEHFYKPLMQSELKDFVKRIPARDTIKRFLKFGISMYKVLLAQSQTFNDKYVS